MADSTGPYEGTVPCLAVCTPTTCPGDAAVAHVGVHTLFDCPRYTPPPIEQVWRASPVRKADAANGDWRQFESVARPGMCITMNNTLVQGGGEPALQALFTPPACFSTCTRPR